MTFVNIPAQLESVPIPGTDPSGYMLGPDGGSHTWMDGALVTFKAKSADTGGIMSYFECEAPYGWQGPVHRHAHESEFFHITEGQWEIYVKDTVHLAGPGHVLWIPPATPHSIFVRSRRGKGSCYVTPAGFERFFEVVGEEATIPSMPTHQTRVATVDELAAAGEKYGWELVEPAPRRLES